MCFLDRLEHVLVALKLLECRPPHRVYGGFEAREWPTGSLLLGGTDAQVRGVDVPGWCEEVRSCDGVGQDRAELAEVFGVRDALLVTFSTTASMTLGTRSDVIQVAPDGSGSVARGHRRA